VITVPAGVKIYLACGVTDMRHGFDGLSIMAQDVARAAARGRGRVLGALSGVWFYVVHLA